MKKAALRFGIKDGELRGATWKLWNEDDEVYLTGRSLGGSLKISLHKSGSWHLAYTKEVFEDLIAGIVPNQKNRFIETWQRPEPIFPGVVLALRIITPTGSVNNQHLTNKKDMIWLPNAKMGEAIEIYIVITSAETKFDDGWPAKNSGTLVVGSLGLLNGETVWAVYSVIPTPNFENMFAGAMKFFPNRDVSDIKDGETRAFVFGDEPDGSRVIADLAVSNKS